MLQNVHLVPVKANKAQKLKKMRFAMQVSSFTLRQEGKEVYTVIPLFQ